MDGDATSKELCTRKAAAKETVSSKEFGQNISEGGSTQDGNNKMLIEPLLSSEASLEVGMVSQDEADQRAPRITQVGSPFPIEQPSSRLVLSDAALKDITLTFVVSGIKFKLPTCLGMPQKIKGHHISSSQKKGPWYYSNRNWQGADENRELETWIKQFNPDFIFLSETKCQSRRIDTLRGHFAMYDVMVLNSRGDEWHSMGFYGHSETAERKASWALLEKLSRLSIRPWLVAGDFNEILHQKEKSGIDSQPQCQLNDFRRFLEHCNLIDLGCKGPQFTWCNHRDQDPIP
ncbi:UNVERIFIED_CONTAM: hypothetical protein Sangu_1976600 [Sesamum angustifolium]|uniref:Endonuclease/exonuclease/phosphatase domain-containing protein n=1 Tax=Sesamum angustifolium TaxID=2727405 RepID=A0AAW2LZ26_9LAMI